MIDSLSPVNPLFSFLLSFVEFEESLFECSASQWKTIEVSVTLSTDNNGILGIGILRVFIEVSVDNDINNDNLLVSQARLASASNIMTIMARYLMKRFVNIFITLWGKPSLSNLYT